VGLANSGLSAGTTIVMGVRGELAGLIEVLLTSQKFLVVSANLMSERMPYSLPAAGAWIPRYLAELMPAATTSPSPATPAAAATPTQPLLLLGSEVGPGVVRLSLHRVDAPYATVLVVDCKVTDKLAPLSFDDFDDSLNEVAKPWRFDPKAHPTLCEVYLEMAQQLASTFQQQCRWLSVAIDYHNAAGHPEVVKALQERLVRTSATNPALQPIASK
jgi:hypothetical protein